MTDPYRMTREQCDARGIIDVHVHGCQPNAMPYLNGVLIDNVFRACKREGWMDRYAKNDRGVFYLVNDCPAWERLTGKVEIRKAAGDIEGKGTEEKR